jgi:hypothetical protein
MPALTVRSRIDGLEPAGSIQELSAAGASALPPDASALALAACAGRAMPENHQDRAVLEELGNVIVADLAATLSHLYGADEAERRRLTLAPADGAWRIELALGGSALARIRREAAGSARVPDVRPFADALAAEPARLGAHLGHARLCAGVVEALVEGDVVVFDRTTLAPVPLTIEGELPEAGSARIAAQAGAVQVTLIEPPNLTRKQ